MPSENSPPPSPSQRRASFAPGTKLSEMFGRSQTTNSTNGGYSGIAAAAANASAHQRRRMSISTLGLSGSPNQTSPFNPTSRPRQESLSSTSTSPGADNESAIDESGDGPPSAGSSPFARRMSFGARAMRDARGGGAGSFGRASTSSASSQHTLNGRGSQASGAGGVAEEAGLTLSNPFARRTGEGFNWSDQIRSRAERSASIAAPSTVAPSSSPGHHTRAATVAAAEQPVKEVPRQSKAPDAFQERILKGDFYMD